MVTSHTVTKMATTKSLHIVPALLCNLRQGCERGPNTHPRLGASIRKPTRDTRHASYLHLANETFRLVPRGHSHCFPVQSQLLSDKGAESDNCFTDLPHLWRLVEANPERSPLGRGLKLVPESKLRSPFVSINRARSEGNRNFPNDWPPAEELELRNLVREPGFALQSRNFLTDGLCQPSFLPAARNQIESLFSRWWHSPEGTRGTRGRCN